MNLRIFLFLGLILLIPSYIYADTNGIWIDASDIRGGNFGADESSGSKNYNFPQNLDVKGELRANKVFSNGKETATIPYVDGKFSGTKNYVDNEITNIENDFNNEINNIKSDFNSKITNTQNYVDSEITNTRDYLDNEVSDMKSWVQNKNYQKRVSSGCPSGQSIRKIYSNGNVACEYDNYEYVNGVSISCNKNTKCTQTSKKCTNTKQESYNCGKGGCSYKTVCTNYKTVCDTSLTYISSCSVCVSGDCDKS